MVQKEKEKQLAIFLRKNGQSYREILQKVPVAKSTLSLWLKEVGLSTPQKIKLTQKRIDAALRGAETRKRQRIELTEKIYKKAELDIDHVSNRELWLMGIMLYWAEGSKEKSDHVGSGIKFSNSDPLMIRLFLRWLLEIARVTKDEIKFEIFIHDTKKDIINSVISSWSKVTEFPKDVFKYIYFKKGKIKTNRRNTGNSYLGILRINVRRSSVLNRKIAGWIKAINEYYWGVV